jgi:hypothetical protein
MSNQPQAHVADERELPPLPRRTVLYPDSEDRCYALGFTESQMISFVKADRRAASTQGAEVATLNEEILALHRRLAAETLRADQGWDRYENANKDRNYLRSRIAAGAPADTPKQDEGLHRDTGARLRRVAKLAGLTDAMLAGDDEDLFNCSFSLLGQIAYALKYLAVQPAPATAETPKPDSVRNDDKFLTLTFEWLKAQKDADPYAIAVAWENLTAFVDALAAQPAGATDERETVAGDALNTILWLERRLPKGYGEVPHVQRTKEALRRVFHSLEKPL